MTREEWANAAITALVKCDQQDAARICAKLLAEWETGGPVMGDLLGTVTGDALLWADCAPVHELVAYGTAALDRLRTASLGRDTRKRLIADLWQSLSEGDRKAFLAYVQKAAA